MNARRFLVLGLIVWTFASGSARPAPVHAGQADETAIRHVLREYVEGWRDADYERLADVFDPGGHVYWLSGDGDEQHLQSMTFAQIMERDPRPQPEYGSEWSVESLEVVDNHVAAAHLHISRAGGSYLDVLVLHRVAGEWRIVTKTYSTR
ncbi:MAG: hypothetical protein GKS06_09935 [Acidobacteria bacterium]|nr:hypothetical protein [Acidobacteriota bacterium]